MRKSLLKIIITALTVTAIIPLSGCSGNDVADNSGGILVIDNTGDDYLFEAVEKADDEAVEGDMFSAGPEENTAEETISADAAGEEASEEHADEDADDDADASPEEAEDGQDEDTKADEDTGTIVSVTPGSVEQIALDPGWLYADSSKINSGTAALYRAADNRKNTVIGVNAGHGTKGGQSVKTYCHPDKSPKVTGGSTSSGSLEAPAVSGGMTFSNGASEASITLKTAQILRDKLLAKGYDVLMLRDGSDVQLDNVARTVIANNTAACHIAIHFDGDGLNYDKGCFYASTPDALKAMEPVASHWQQHEALGAALIGGLKGAGCKINGGGSMAIDLTQTSYSTVPSVDIELGNQATATDDASLAKLADGLLSGIESFF